jgi:NAD+ synthase
MRDTIYQAPTFKDLEDYNANLMDRKGTDNFNRDALSNLKARLRMATLYEVAQENNYLVIGTSNKVEIYLGYFTK